MKRLIDIALILPFLPLAPFLLVWWLPWERWVSRRVPKWFLGPYILYGALAAAHFHQHLWCVLGLAVVGTGVSASAAYDELKKRPPI
jgi:hypothetical protein